MAELLPIKEVLSSVSSGNRKAAICSDFVLLIEPSDGLEPSIPSLPCCVASSVAALSEGQRRVRGDGGMTLYHAGGIWLPLERPVSRRRFARLAGDLIEACVLCPTQPCPGRSTTSTDRRLGDAVDGRDRCRQAQGSACSGGVRCAWRRARWS